MLKKYAPVVLAMSVILFAASCAKEGPNGPTGPAGPSFTGSIAGHVSLYDQYGSPVLTNLANAKVFLKALIPANTFIPDTAIGVDANGYFAYTNTVTTGTYSLAAIDTPLYGAAFLGSFNYVSGIAYHDIKMSAIPTFTIDSFKAMKNTLSTGDSLVIYLAADTRIRNFIVFVNSASTVSNIIGNYLLVYVKQIPANSTMVSVAIPAQDLYNAGIVSGGTAYYAAYSYVVNDASVYEDYGTGKKVYNSVSAAVLAASAIVP